MAASFPQQIDRFHVRQVLGHGSQGVVYLADDPDLKRKVAIKSVHLKNNFQRIDTIDHLLAEARTVSRLQHANIVSIFDIGMLNDNPYLVLEYIDGQSLQQKISSAPSMKEKIKIMGDVLEGVAAAHAQNIIHCDIKPANILIGQQGEAKVTDFGLALLTDGSTGNDDALYGTPQYMAPEYIESRQHQKVSDVFSIGLVCYELLTGSKAFAGKDVYQILNAISNTQLAPPSKYNPDIDDRLDGIIIKSLAKDPAERFADAGEMLHAFNDYMALDTANSRRDGGDATVGFLLRRMRHQKDFPVFSHTISALNQASSSDTESLTTVSNVILKDYSLTNKILRLVNSAYYNRGGTKISTISRAVVMLGIDTVKSLATGLMLFEHMQNKLQASRLKENAVQALFSGLLANSVARMQEIASHEEAFLCALLQQLGKMLVYFYLNDEARAIDKLVLQQGCSEDTAVTQVLGISYARLGMSVAREWGFPSLITGSMQALDFDKLNPAKDTTESLQQVAHFSNALAACLNLPLEQQAPAIKTLTRQFSDVLDLDEAKVSDLLQSCHQELTGFARLIQFDLDKSLYYQQISSSGMREPEAPVETARREAFGADASVEILVEQSASSAQSVEKALTDGIQDITNTLTGDYSINQITQMILETIYRALTGSRVVLCLKDKQSGQIRARYGYGENLNQLTEHFSVPLQGPPDVFFVALKNNVDIRIDNTQDDKIRKKLPAWFHQHIASKSFTLFPIVIKQSPVALIYIDSPGDKPILISDDQLSLLKTLRNQAILAIKNLT